MNKQISAVASVSIAALLLLDFLHSLAHLGLGVHPQADNKIPAVVPGITSKLDIRGKGVLKKKSIYLFIPSGNS